MKYLYNPFARIAGLQALLYGLAIALIAALLASFFATRFDGVMDAHFVTSEVSLATALVDQAVNALSLFAVFYLAALVLGARHVRPVDMLGTLLLARAPYAVLPLFNIGDFFSGRAAAVMESIHANPTEPDLSLVLPLVPMILLTLVILVWLIVLYFYAWKVCTHLKGAKLVVGFIVALLGSEALSLFLLSIL